MIYILSENNYLVLGIRRLMHPLNCMQILPGPTLATLHHNVTSRDLIIIDTASPDYIFMIEYALSGKPSIVFINHTQSKEVCLRIFNPLYRTLSIYLPLPAFGKVLHDARQERVNLSSRITSLTPTETYVFKASLKALTVQEISFQSGIAEKTVYAHRRRACQKLGVSKVNEVIPFLRTIAWF